MLKENIYEKFMIFICLLSTIATSVIILCTLITTYQFKNLGQIFNSYSFMQFTSSITMFLWAIRFFISYRGRQKYIYSLISFSLSLGLLFFMNKL